jgi:hypothetical protein
MYNGRNSQLNTLLIILSVLAIGGGLAIVLVTSPQSLLLSQYNLLPGRTTDPATLTASPTATGTPLPPSATLAPSSTRLPPAATVTVASPTASPTGSPTPSPTPTFPVIQLPNGTLPSDVRGIAVVKPLADSQTARVRDLPNGSKLVAAVAGGTRLQVLFGQAVVDDIEWVEVRLNTLQTGWIARSLITFTYERPSGTVTAEAPPT